MFTRSILVPSLLVCAICAPILLTHKNIGTSVATSVPVAGELSNFQNGYPQTSNFNQADLAIAATSNTRSRNLSVNSQNAPRGGFGATPSNISTPTSASSYRQPTNPAERKVPFGLVSQSQPASNYLAATSGNFSGSRNVPGHLVGSDLVGSGVPIGIDLSVPPTGISTMIPGGSMTPDMGSAETFVFPGNEFGPDLSAPPMQFMPVTNLGEIFRFDAASGWVKQRGKRVSTAPGEVGLHGLRVALVTGTNSWDLHGSLTYYFDSSQRCQRITFRGWTGDASKLLEVLTRNFEFKPQPSHLAGFYAASRKRVPTGALLMKHPAVIYRDNPVQQLAIVLEINNANSSFVLSHDFHSLIEGSVTN